jgi:hypothetical protein
VAFLEGITDTLASANLSDIGAAGWEVTANTQF